MSGVQRPMPYVPRPMSHFCAPMCKGIKNIDGAPKNKKAGEVPAEEILRATTLGRTRATGRGWNSTRPTLFGNYSQIDPGF